MNKSLLALICATSLLAACFWKKKAENVAEEIKTEMVHDEVTPVAASQEDANDDSLSDDNHDDEDDTENDEK